MMESLEIGSTPALLSGPESESVFLFVHGLHGNKEESVPFAEVAVQLGYQVLGIDLPLERKPWEVLPLLYEVRDYLYGNWRKVSIRANSIGAWFSLLSFQGRGAAVQELVRKIDEQTDSFIREDVPMIVEASQQR